MEESMDICPTYRGNIFSSPVESRDWRIYLTDMNDDPKNHLEAVDVIRTAGPGDVVTIFITCSGGRVDVADMYLSAIKDAAAQVVTRVSGECSSAATSVFLAGHERLCDDGSFFMFHNVQIGSDYSDSANVFKSAKFFEKLYREKFYAEMAEVLTATEMAELFERAGEIYLSAEDMRGRLEGLATPKEDLGPTPVLVDLPFPGTKVKEAAEFLHGDEFDITLDDGYKKTFRLATLSIKDFDEYSVAEIEEIGDAFGLDFPLYPSRNELIRALIDFLQGDDE